MFDYIVEVLGDDGITFGNTDVAPPVVEVILEGPQGSPGPVLLLENGESVPEDTPEGTIIFEKDV